MSLEALRTGVFQQKSTVPQTGDKEKFREDGSPSPAAAWVNGDWARYQAIYAAVKDYHRRHMNMTGTLAEWTEALEDLKHTCQELNNAPLVIRLLSAVYGELERTVVSGVRE